MTTLKFSIFLTNLSVDKAVSQPYHLSSISSSRPSARQPWQIVPTYLLNTSKSMPSLRFYSSDTQPKEITSTLSTPNDSAIHIQRYDERHLVPSPSQKHQQPRIYKTITPAVWRTAHTPRKERDGGIFSMGQATSMKDTTIVIPRLLKQNKIHRERTISPDEEATDAYNHRDNRHKTWTGSLLTSKPQPRAFVAISSITRGQSCSYSTVTSTQAGLNSGVSQADVSGFSGFSYTPHNKLKLSSNTPTYKEALTVYEREIKHLEVAKASYIAFLSDANYFRKENSAEERALTQKVRLAWTKVHSIDIWLQDPHNRADGSVFPWPVGGEVLDSNQPSALQPTWGLKTGATSSSKKIQLSSSIDEVVAQHRIRRYRHHTILSTDGVEDLRQSLQSADVRKGRVRHLRKSLQDTGETKNLVRRLQTSLQNIDGIESRRKERRGTVRTAKEAFSSNGRSPGSKSRNATPKIKYSEGRIRLIGFPRRDMPLLADQAAAEQKLDSQEETITKNLRKAGSLKQPGNLIQPGEWKLGPTLKARNGNEISSWNEIEKGNNDKLANLSYLQTTQELDQGILLKLITRITELEESLGGLKSLFGTYVVSLKQPLPKPPIAPPIPSKNTKKSTASLEAGSFTDEGSTANSKVERPESAMPSGEGQDVMHFNVTAKGSSIPPTKAEAAGDPTEKFKTADADENAPARIITTEAAEEEASLPQVSMTEATSLSWGQSLMQVMGQRLGIIRESQLKSPNIVEAPPSNKSFSSTDVSNAITGMKIPSNLTPTWGRGFTAPARVDQSSKQNTVLLLSSIQRGPTAHSSASPDKMLSSSVSDHIPSASASITRRIVQIRALKKRSKGEILLERRLRPVASDSSSTFSEYSMPMKTTSTSAEELRQLVQITMNLQSQLNRLLKSADAAPLNPVIRKLSQPSRQQEHILPTTRLRLGARRIPINPHLRNTKEYHTCTTLSHRHCRPFSTSARFQHESQTPRLTHVSSSGTAHMVAIGDKMITSRTAVAVCTVRFSNEIAVPLIQSNQMKKGDVLGVARIAGIMAAKRTPELIPLCHPISITQVSIQLDVLGPLDDKLEAGTQETMSSSWAGTGQGDAYSFHKLASTTRHIPNSQFGSVEITASISCDGKTGVEMEALTAASIAALTVYDMCKAVDKGMRIEGLRVVKKEGGKSGSWTEAS